MPSKILRFSSTSESTITEVLNIARPVGALPPPFERGREGLLRLAASEGTWRRCAGCSVLAPALRRCRRRVGSRTN
jgi:hypothetical protein